MSELDEAQQAAVNALDGPVLIRAGAGAGKTRVLVHRGARLVESGVPARNILLVTFTNKAAGEIAERLGDMVGRRSCEMVISTLHSFAWRWIVKPLADMDALGAWERSRGLRIARRDLMRRIQRDAWMALPKTARKAMEKSGVNADLMQRALGIVRAGGVRAGDIDEACAARAADRTANTDDQSDEIVEWLASYGEAIEYGGADANVIDFDDILVIANGALQADPEVRSALRERFRYLQVDEFQDTNPVQLDICDALAREHRNLCVCGDDRQAIYSFRGADPRILDHYMERYPEARIVELASNYRSSARVVAAANACASAMPPTLSGELAPMRARRRLLKARQPQIWQFGDDKDEAQALVDWLLDMDRANTVVLFRSRYVKDELEQALKDAGIAYELVTDTGFFDHQEVRIALGLAQAWTLCERGAWSQTLGRLAAGMGEDKAEQLWAEGGFAALEAVAQERAREGKSNAGTLVALLGEGRAVYEQIRQVGDYNTVDTISRRGALARRLNAAWGRWIAPRLETMWCNRVKDKKTGEVAEEDAAEIEARLALAANRVHLLNRMIDRLWQHRDSMARVFDGLELFEPGEDDRVDEQDTDVLRLMSVHAAKGLEAQTIVYLGGADVARGQRLAMSEERRVFYVALTRARDELVVTGAGTRLSLGELQCDRVESPFVRELGETVTQQKHAPDSEAAHHLGKLRAMLQ